MIDWGACRFETERNTTFGGGGPVVFSGRGGGRPDQRRRGADHRQNGPSRRSVRRPPDGAWGRRREGRWTGIRDSTAWAAIVSRSAGPGAADPSPQAGHGWAVPRWPHRPNEDPARGRGAEVREETGAAVELAPAGTPFNHRAVVTHPVPFRHPAAGADDPAVEPHQLRSTGLCVPCHFPRSRPRPGEIRDCRWVPVEEVATYHVPPHLPDLMAAAAAWSTAVRPWSGEGAAPRTDEGIESPVESIRTGLGVSISTGSGTVGAPAPAPVPRRRNGDSEHRRVRVVGGVDEDGGGAPLP